MWTPYSVPTELGVGLGAEVAYIGNLVASVVLSSQEPRGELIRYAQLSCCLAVLSRAEGNVAVAITTDLHPRIRHGHERLPLYI